MTVAKLYYFHDPMCSWCWGYRRTAVRLFAGLPEGVMHENILGGLAADNDSLMPAYLKEAIRSHWQRIESTLGTKFNYDFWTQCTPRRSTYPACRAVIAAAYQQREEEMILAIQRAYYLQARNPSDTTTHIELADELGLDVRTFGTDLKAQKTETELQRQIEFSRRCGVSSFPSLILSRSGHSIRLEVDYNDHKSTIEKICQVIRSN